MQRYSSLKFLFMYFYASAAVLSSTTAETKECGVINTKEFLNNEQVTEIDEFPWMARVAFNQSQDLGAEPQTSFFCQAVLISQRHLLAIASCVGRNFVEPHAVLLAVWNISKDYSETSCDGITGKCSTPKLIEIDEIIIHPLHHSLRRENDIAILRLSEPIAFSDYIRPICLPGKEIANKEFGSEELKLTGFLLGKDEKSSTGPKQKMSVFIYNQHDCRRKFADLRRFTVTDSHLCGTAGNVGVNLLSGAALMDVKDIESPQEHGNAYLVGLVAYGRNSTFGRDQQVFIRIDKYLDWIEKNLY